MACSDNVIRAGLTPKKKDVEKLKEILSKESWLMLEEEAKAEELSAEELIKQKSRGDITEKLMSEFGEEKIKGNEATVKIKNSLNGKWGDMYLIKEDEKWKVDIAKTMKMMQEIFEKNISDKDLDNFKK